MKCSQRSTTWCGSAALLLACGLRLGAAGPGGEDARAIAARASAARQAIIEAVKGRMGPDTDVRIENLRLGGVPGAADGTAPLAAAAEPGARLGRSIRFSLSRASASAARPVPAGYALATVFVTAEHARAARTIARGAVVAAEDMVASCSEVGQVLLQRLPRTGEIVGTRALRDIRGNEVMTRTVVALRPMVQSGDVVAVQAGGEGVMVQTRGVAAQSGGPGETIRVVNPESRRSLKARVLAPGKVEVVQ